MWICRTWTCRNEVGGWFSEFDSFETLQEAEAFGELHMRLMREDDLGRDYEIYRKEVE